ncbi:AmmeMemoRadiSam system protein B [Anaerotalea alkaliphila]|uniref:AmmeMemoRadiSam system protein B n=1 Tax=Anaerotalea alkaliphila TaxID=2662126 RepID=A0A7X5HTT2_9FIRM|nr:AmmeMemoRadiSam system protein B [Anaerotalea alkaliphila]NDL66519.1 AmmeMemoRadiSam system protein B [Anaerotalea alkaliphila]
MSRSNRLLVVALVLLALLAGRDGLETGGPAGCGPVSATLEPAMDMSAFLPDKFLARGRMQAGEAYPLEEGQKVLGAVVPHHLVAGQLLHKTYKTLKEKANPDIIVLMGPNHGGEGPQVQAARTDFHVEGVGRIFHASNVVAPLLEKGACSPALAGVLQREHSTGVHLHYIGEFFPGVPVVVLLLNEPRRMEGLKTLAEGLAEVLGDASVLYLASIDFSHHLPLEAADRMDALTAPLVLERNHREVIGLSNRHLDSPSSFVLWSLLLELEDPGVRIRLLDKGNSARILQRPELGDTTSYMILMATTDRWE